MIKFIFIWHILLRYATCSHQNMKPSDWTVVEVLAEEHPYIVALLNHTKNYICTGTIISKQAVLTSGNCVKHDPHYIAVALAVLGEDINANNIHKVEFTKLHSDYIFELNATPNTTLIHSNIGLVFAAQPILKFGVENADVGDYYASQLREMKLTVVGFGKLTDSNVTVLQEQAYHQSPCTYPKWYYCVCGFEYSVEPKTYQEEFGEGAPVLFGSEVVAVTVTHCGRLKMSDLNINYNIFTVLGPYTAWIEKTHSLNVEDKPSARALHSSADHVQMKRPKKSIYILFLITKLLI